MVSPARRQVIIAGLATPLIPAVGFAVAAEPATAEKLVLSGRILRSDGKPLAGAMFPIAGQSAVTDADGRFLVISDTQAAGRLASIARRDGEGTWRVTVGLG